MPGVVYLSCTPAAENEPGTCGLYSDDDNGAGGGEVEDSTTPEEWRASVRIEGKVKREARMKEGNEEDLIH